MQRKVVAVCPARERGRHERLFDALEEFLPVRFEGRRPGELNGADGAMIITAEDQPAATGHEAGLPLLIAHGDEPDPDHGGPEGGSVRLADSDRLDRRLRGQLIDDPAARRAYAVEPAGGDAVLAAADGVPLWTSRGRGAARRDSVAFAPRELAPGEPLRARIQDGRALALLPLLHYLRELTAEIDFRPPPLRASFLIDDPNLHWTSYGHLRYPELTRHADEYGYHVAMAMVPLDGWLAHPAASRLFRERSDRLSLLFHGNNHVLKELGRPILAEHREALLAQALRRMASFERRTGIRVARVMAAPHGDCSEETASDLLRLGFEALCIGRPYPWAARPPDSWLTGPHDASPLAALAPSTAVVGGLPVLLRRPFGYSAGDLALRAFLDQPLIIYGHHDDLVDGLEPFAHWAERVRALGDPHWGSLGEIAASNYATRREGDLLCVRMHARRIVLDLTDDVQRLRVQVPGGDGDERVLVNGADSGALGANLPLAADSLRVELSLARPGQLDPTTIPRPDWSPWPLARRFAGEGRDRFSPLLRRAARRRETHSGRRS